MFSSEFRERVIHPTCSGKVVVLLLFTLRLFRPCNRWGGASTWCMAEGALDSWARLLKLRLMLVVMLLGKTLELASCVKSSNLSALQCNLQRVESCKKPLSYNVRLRASRPCDLQRYFRWLTTHNWRGLGGNNIAEWSPKLWCRKRFAELRLGTWWPWTICISGRRRWRVVPMPSLPFQVFACARACFSVMIGIYTFPSRLI